ncbi:hypothetical protein V1478_001498 [Vespula squamosa]|uniref:Uncharacterized protein n=1 Tax=Vespula squamosa TaxID=30214 RepID=A0ABD2C1L7_VESSQ
MITMSMNKKVVVMGMNKQMLQKIVTIKITNETIISEFNKALSLSYSMNNMFKKRDKMELVIAKEKKKQNKKPKKVEEENNFISHLIDRKILLKSVRNMIEEITLNVHRKIVEMNKMSLMARLKRSTFRKIYHRKARIEEVLNASQKCIKYFDIISNHSLYIFRECFTLYSENISKSSSFKQCYQILSTIATITALENGKDLQFAPPLNLLYFLNIHKMQRIIFTIPSDGNMLIRVHIDLETHTNKSREGVAKLDLLCTYVIFNDLTINKFVLNIVESSNHCIVILQSIGTFDPPYIILSQISIALESKPLGFRETICSRESNASELNTINKQLITFKYYEVFIFVEFVVKLNLQRLRNKKISEKRNVWKRQKGLENRFLVLEEMKILIFIIKKFTDPFSRPRSPQLVAELLRESVGSSLLESLRTNSDG